MSDIEKKSTIEKLLESRPGFDHVLISRPIDRLTHSKLTRLIGANKRKQKNCTLFLTTYGGDPDGGYRIGRCLRHNYEQIRLVVPSFCKSAGTLVAISADVLVICDLGELGPLDIQVRKPTEVNERSSGLDIQEAMKVVLQHAIEAFRDSLIDIRFGGGLSTKLAAEFASRVATGIAEPLYAQVDPNRLGELQRAMRITHEYGMRLNERRSGPGNLQNDALNRLVAGYPSHGFVIDRKEARALFRNVESPTSEEMLFCEKYWELLGYETDIGPLFVEELDDVIGAEDESQSNEPQESTQGNGRQPIKVGGLSEGASKKVAGLRKNGGKPATDTA